MCAQICRECHMRNLYRGPVKAPCMARGSHPTSYVRANLMAPPCTPGSCLPHPVTRMVP